MSKTMQMNYCNGCVYVMNNETGECDNIFLFTYLDKVEEISPEFRGYPDLYNAWLFYRSEITKPLPALERG